MRGGKVELSKPYHLKATLYLFVSSKGRMTTQFMVMTNDRQVTFSNKEKSD